MGGLSGPMRSRSAKASRSLPPCWDVEKPASARDEKKKKKKSWGSIGRGSVATGLSKPNRLVTVLANFQPNHSQSTQNGWGALGLRVDPRSTFRRYQVQWARPRCVNQPACPSWLLPFRGCDVLDAPSWWDSKESVIDKRFPDSHFGGFFPFSVLVKALGQLPINTTRWPRTSINDIPLF